MQRESHMAQGWVPSTPSPLWAREGRPDRTSLVPLSSQGHATPAPLQPGLTLPQHQFLQAGPHPSPHPLSLPSQPPPPSSAGTATFPGKPSGGLPGPTSRVRTTHQAMETPRSITPRGRGGQSWPQTRESDLLAPGLGWDGGELDPALALRAGRGRPHESSPEAPGSTHPSPLTLDTQAWGHLSSWPSCSSPRSCPSTSKPPAHPRIPQNSVTLLFSCLPKRTGPCRPWHTAST